MSADDPTSRLLAWYEENRRDLPWRGRTDPYEIWVSEIMLQQTRSETVEHYYQRFLDRFPDLESLARASEDEVLAAWSGLGYYRRARQLRRAVREVVEAGGEVPASLEALRRLPGIGPYTAAAIASLAYGVPEPVVDGNVERVLSRYRAVREPPRKAAGRRRLGEIARQLLDERHPGAFNQALMELGALICTPHKPECERCPLSAECLAHAERDEERFPVIDRRPSVVRESWVAVVARSGDDLLLARRPLDARQMPGFWELPWVNTTSGEPAASLAVRYGGTWRLGRVKGMVRHSITTRALEVTVHEGGWEADDIAETGLGRRLLQWFAECHLAELPTSSLVGKILAVL